MNISKSNAAFNPSHSEVTPMQSNKQELVEKVIRLIVEDVEYGDLQSIEGLLMLVPESTLIGFLPED